MQISRGTALGLRSTGLPLGQRDFEGSRRSIHVVQRRPERHSWLRAGQRVTTRPARNPTTKTSGTSSRHLRIKTVQPDREKLRRAVRTYLFLPPASPVASIVVCYPAGAFHMFSRSAGQQAPAVSQHALMTSRVHQ